MRVVVDRGAAAVRLVLGEAAEVRRVEAGDGVAVLYDGAERVVGVEVRGVDAAALHGVTVELAGLTERPGPAAIAPHAPGPAAIAPPPPQPAAIAPRYPAPTRSAPPPAPTPAPYTGPLTWDPEAEAAMGQVPFFSRGRHRLAAGALARARGLDRVTLEVVHAVGR